MNPNDVGDILLTIILILGSIAGVWFVYVIWLIVKSRQEFQEYFRESAQKRLWWYINDYRMANDFVIFFAREKLGPYNEGITEIFGTFNYDEFTKVLKANTAYSELYKQFEFYETQLKLLVERDEETDFFVYGNLDLMVQVIDKQTGKVLN